MLGRAAGALHSEREQIDRLDVLVAIGHESRVRLTEQVLLQRAVRRVADGFDGDGVRVGLLGGGHLRFPEELSTDRVWVVADDVTHRRPIHPRPTHRRPIHPPRTAPTRTRATWARSTSTTCSPSR